MTRNNLHKDAPRRGFDDVAFANTHIRSTAELFARSVITTEEFNVAIEAILHTKGRHIDPLVVNSDQEVAFYPVLKSVQDGPRVASVTHLPKLDIYSRPITSVRDELEKSLISVDAEKTFQSFSDMLLRLTQEFLSKESCASMGKILVVYNPSPTVWASACLDMKLNKEGKIDATLQIFAKQDLAFSKILTNLMKKLIAENKSIVLTTAPQRLIESQAEDFMVQLVLAQAVFDGLDLDLNFDQIESLVEIKSREQVFDKIYEAYQYKPGQANETRFMVLKDVSAEIAMQKHNPFLILYPFIVSADESFEIYNKLHNMLCFLNEGVLAEECLSALGIIRGAQLSSDQALNLLSRWALEKTILVQNPEFQLQQIDATDDIYVFWLEQALIYCKRGDEASVLRENYLTIENSWFVNHASWSLNKQYQAVADLTRVMVTKEINPVKFKQQYYGFVSVQVAAILNQDGLLSGLIDMGIDQTLAKILPVHLAAHNSHFESLKACLSKNPELVTSHGQNGNNLLHTIILGLIHQSRFNQSLIDYLISEFKEAVKAMLFEQNASGKTPFLMTSSPSANPVFISIILNRSKLDIDLGNLSDRTFLPTQIESYSGKGGKADCLTDKNIARILHLINYKDNPLVSSSSDIFTAIKHNNFVEIWRYINSPDFNPNIISDQGFSIPLYIINTKEPINKVEQLQLFLDFGVGLNYEEGKALIGESALAQALRSSQFDEAKVLCCSGAFFPETLLDLISDPLRKAEFSKIRARFWDRSYELVLEILASAGADKLSLEYLNENFQDLVEILYSDKVAGFTDRASAIRLLMPKERKPDSVAIRNVKPQELDKRISDCAENGYLKELIFWLGQDRATVKASGDEHEFLLEKLIRQAEIRPVSLEIVQILIDFGFNQSLIPLTKQKSSSRKSDVLPKNLLELAASIGDRPLVNLLLQNGYTLEQEALNCLPKDKKSSFSDLIARLAQDAEKRAQALVEEFSSKDNSLSKTKAPKKKSRKQKRGDSADRPLVARQDEPSTDISSGLDLEGSSKISISLAQEVLTSNSVSDVESDEEGIWQIVGSNGRANTKLKQQSGRKNTKPVQVEPIVQSGQLAPASVTEGNASQGDKQAAAPPSSTSELRSHSPDSDKSVKLMADLKSLEDILLNKLGCSLVEKGSDTLSFTLEKSHSITFNRVYGRYFGMFFNASSNILQGNKVSFAKGVKDLFEPKLLGGLGCEEIVSQFVAEITDLARALEHANNVKKIFSDSNIEISKESLVSFIQGVDLAAEAYSEGRDNALEMVRKGALGMYQITKESSNGKAYLAGLDEFKAIKDMARDDIDRYKDLYNFGVSLVLHSEVKKERAVAMVGKT